MLELDIDGVVIPAGSITCEGGQWSVTGVKVSAAPDGNSLILKAILTDTDGNVGTSAGVSVTKSLPSRRAYGQGYLAIGRYHSCALTPQGQVRCWGGGSSRGALLGYAADDDAHNTAVVMADTDGLPLSGIVQVAISDNVTCALTAEGKVKCLGQQRLLGGGQSRHRSD